MRRKEKISVPLTEDELRGPVERLFPAEKYVSWREVPFGLKRIDLVFKSRRNGGYLTAVELKVRDWRRAVWQAVHNRQIAVFSYVALPYQCISAVDRGMLRCLCLGLIVTDTTVARILVPAKKSQFVNKRLEKQIAAFLERR